MLNAMLALAAIWWAQYARIVRAQVLVTRQESFVEAATALGRGRLAVLVREILTRTASGRSSCAPRSMSATPCSSSPGSASSGSAPSRPPPSGGAILTRSREYLIGYWWYPTFPGLAIFLTSLAFSFLGDAFRDALDPRSRKYV